MNERETALRNEWAALLAELRTFKHNTREGRSRKRKIHARIAEINRQIDHPKQQSTEITSRELPDPPLSGLPVG